MGGKERKKKKKKPPPRRKPRSSGASPVSSSSGKRRPTGGATVKSPPFLRRLRALRIVTSEGEHPADVAVAQPRKAGPLDPEWAGDVEVVREALQLVASGKDQQARDALRRIPRRSPLSQWRLFLSGLSDWYAGDVERAESAWQRLDPSRRPARIATVLRKAGGSSEPAGDEATTAPVADTSSGPSISPLDEATIENRAVLVRGLRFERPALKELAQATLRRSRPGKGEKFPLPLVNWLISWRATYSPFEPELVAAVQRNALALAFDQPENEVFERLATSLPGPPHDPINRLYLSWYFNKFRGAEDEAEACREEYLQQDLPRCHELGQPTRAAIESLLHLETARESQAPPARGMLVRFMEPPDTREAEDAYKSAIKAYPANRTAHREYVDLIRGSGDPYDDTKKDEEARDRRIRRVMERWSKSLPDDIEPRLWLVNYYLEHEELKPAAPHVEMLQRQRLQDPRVRTLPWRWALFESMRLARHKRRVDQARQQLDEAESLWPEWLAKDWLPFLRAVLAWRAGETETYQRLREEAEASVGGFPLLSNIMLFAAARRMHIPSGGLKPLRQTFSELTDDAEKIDLTDLLKTGRFLWDLDRTTMLYTGYRAQGPRLIQELCARFSAPDLELPDEPLGPAALWSAGTRFASGPYELEVPTVIEDRKTTDPLLGASVLRALTEKVVPRKYFSRERETFEFVKSAVDTTRDPFYRHYFQSLVDELSEEFAPIREPDRFDEDEDDEMARFWGEEEDEWDNEEELCNCVNCRRARGELGPDEDGPESFSAAKEIMAQMFEEVVGGLDPETVEGMRQAGLFDDEPEAGAGKRRKKAKKR